MSPGERGEVSLTSVLVACTLLVVVLGATLGMFEGFIAKAGDQTRRTDSQDAARSAVDRIARDLRNLASPTPDQPQAVDLALGRDLIFKTVDSAGPYGLNATNTKRVRYCLDGAGSLREQTQTWTTATIPAVPSVSGCPAVGWDPGSAIAATDIVNPMSHDVFTYDSTVLTDISAIHVELLVDTDIARLPPATSLSTGVFLRNQNRRPRALFSSAKTSGGVVLNGSESVDPEGDPLEYRWFNGATQVGTGITFTYTPLASGEHWIRLEVSDPAGLTESITQKVTA